MRSNLASIVLGSSRALLDQTYIDSSSTFLSSSCKVAIVVGRLAGKLPNIMSAGPLESDRVADLDGRCSDDAKGPVNVDRGGGHDEGAEESEEDELDHHGASSECYCCC